MTASLVDIHSLALLMASSMSLVSAGLFRVEDAFLAAFSLRLVPYTAASPLWRCLPPFPCPGSPAYCRDTEKQVENMDYHKIPRRSQYVTLGDPMDS